MPRRSPSRNEKGKRALALALLKHRPMRSFEASLAAAITLQEVTTTLTSAVCARIPDAAVAVVACGDRVAFPEGHDHVSRPLVTAEQTLRSFRVAAPILTAGDIDFLEGLVPAASLAVAAVLLATRDALPDDPPEGAPASARLDSRIARVAYVWGLTARQQFVLGLAARGLSNKDIARSVGNSVRTVEAHMSQILIKAGVDSRGAAVAKLWNTDPESLPAEHPGLR